MEGFKSLQKEGTTNEGRPQGKHEQIKYSKLPLTRSISNKEKEGTPPKKHLALKNSHLQQQQASK